MPLRSRNGRINNEKKKSRDRCGVSNLSKEPCLREWYPTMAKIVTLLPNRHQKRKAGEERRSKES